MNGTQTENNLDIAECFSEHFYSLPHTIRSRIPDSNIDGLSHIDASESSMLLYDSTPGELDDLIRSMKQGRKNDNFVVRMVRLATYPFAVVLSALFNIYVAMGKYPDELKIANIVPIYKSGSRKCVENYRPIAILKNLNKLFVKFLCNRLLSFFKFNKILSPAQFGFKKGFSTEIAILQLVTYILPAFQNRGFALSIFLDFSKAFNTVNPHILLRKLEKYGVRGLPLRLLSSYLNDRVEYVTYNKQDSGKRIINLGVPQGSCLGPLLFIIYTNDFCKYLEAVDKVLYADDTSLVVCGNNVENVIAEINVSLNKLYDWCNFNGLALNCTKTKAVLFTNKIIVNPSLQIHGNTVEFVDAYRYLGILLDSKLKYQEHINSLKIKLSQLCGISYRISPYLNLEAAKAYYYSFVYSALSYCITVWGGVLVSSTRGNRLRRLQKRIVKNLFAKFFYVSLDIDLFKKLEILPVVYLYKFRMACLMFKMIKLEQYPNILAYINPETLTHNYETRNQNYVLPFPIVETIRLNFKYQLINIWNEIPENIRELESYNMFKGELRKSLFNTMTL